jgi:hypothetical protein
MTKIVKTPHFGASFHNSEHAVLVFHGFHHWYLLVRDDL